jgi:hypothetical protein
MVLYDGGHVSSIEVEQRETRPWLDEMLGRVFR